MRQPFFTTLFQRHNKNTTLKLVSGFSLLELLIYISILSILVVAISSTFISLSKGRGQSNAKSEVNNAIRFATELIRQDLKNASSVSIPAVGTPNKSLVLVRDGNTITYDIAGGYLTRNGVNVNNSNVLVDATKNANAFTRAENPNIGFNTTNLSILVNIIFDYNSTSSDWIYSTNLRTTVSLYSNI